MLLTGPLVSSNSQSAISPFTFAYNVLAICVGGGDITRADLLKLLEMSRYRDGDASQTYSYYHIGKKKKLVRSFPMLLTIGIPHIAHVKLFF